MDTPKNEEKLNTSSKTQPTAGAPDAASTGDGTRPEAHRRKKNIIRVYHAQNASDGGKSRTKKAAGEKRTRPAGAAGARPGQAARPAGAIAAGTAHGAARLAGTAAARPAGARPAAGTARPAEAAEAARRPLAGV